MNLDPVGVGGGRVDGKEMLRVRVGWTVTYPRLISGELIITSKKHKA